MPPNRPPKTLRRELTPAERNEILRAYRSGAKAPEIAASFGFQRGAVYFTIAKAVERVDNKPLPRSRPRKTDDERDQQLAESAMAAPTRPLRELNRDVVPEVALQTVQRRLKERTIRKFHTRRKPMLTMRHRSLRLTRALEHVTWPITLTLGPLLVKILTR
jgi:transposase